MAKLVNAGSQALTLVKVAVGVLAPKVMTLQLVYGVSKGLPVGLVINIVDLSSASGASSGMLLVMWEGGLCEGEERSKEINCESEARSKTTSRRFFS